jgi:hypothetical protein
MNLSHALVIAALAASLLLVFKLKHRLFPGIALAVSVIEAMLSFRVVHFSVSGVNLMLVLGALLAVAGGLVWAKSSGKMHTTAATVVTLVGAIQVFSALV